MSSVSKPTERECVTPRGHGGGDGIRQNISTRKRVPISSARKFNARAPRDESLKLKLETALDDLCGTKKQDIRNQVTPNRHQKCLLKSASVAEITPTMTKARRRSSINAEEDSSELYATPRPLDYGPKIRFCPHDRIKCRVYKRLMLLAWRRSRANVLASNNLLKKQEEHVNQLQMQVDVLNKLRVSEGQKRDETLVEYQKLRKDMEILELENSQLNEEVQNLQNSFEIVQNNLKMAKSENNFLSEQILKMQETIGKKKTEKRSLEEKINLQAQEITSQKTTITCLEETLNGTNKSLKNMETNYRIKERKYAQLKCEFKKQIDANNSLSKQFQSLNEEKISILSKVEDLETQLNEFIQSCEVLRDANDELTQEIHEMSMELGEEKKQTWVKSSKQLASLSLSALQKIAYIMLPAYLDDSQYK